ncbi:TPA: hypothetical protein PC505_003591 [Morganella morganii]|nr:hypothetical protein [Morganella morganii]HDF2424145.1 hypothetical protein [Morganella morganii]
MLPKEAIQSPNHQERKLDSMISELNLLENMLLYLVSYLKKPSDELSSLLNAQKKKRQETQKKRKSVKEESLESNIKDIKKMVSFCLINIKKQLQQ